MLELLPALTEAIAAKKRIKTPWRIRLRPSSMWNVPEWAVNHVLPAAFSVMVCTESPMPTETKFLGVYGAVWLAVLAAAATVSFARRMWQLLRILLLGAGRTAWTTSACAWRPSCKEVLFQSRMLRGGIDHQLGPSGDLLGLLHVRAGLGAAVRRDGIDLRPELHIPAGGSKSPCWARSVDLFAVIVLGGPDRLLDPPLPAHARRGLQRTADATIVVSLIAALIGHLPHGRGGRPRRSEPMAPEAQWRCRARRGCPSARCWHRRLHGRRSAPRETIVRLGIGAWWVHALILLLLPGRTCPTRSTCTCFGRRRPSSSPSCRTRACCLPSEEKAGRRAAIEPANPLAGFTWRHAAERLRLRRVRRVRAGLPRGRQRWPSCRRGRSSMISRNSSRQGVWPRSKAHAVEGQWRDAWAARHARQARRALGLLHVPRLRGNLPVHVQQRADHRPPPAPGGPGPGGRGLRSADEKPRYAIPGPSARKRPEWAKPLGSS